MVGFFKSLILTSYWIHWLNSKDFLHIITGQFFYWVNVSIPLSPTHPHTLLIPLKTFLSAVWNTWTAGMWCFFMAMVRPLVSITVHLILFWRWNDHMLVGAVGIVFYFFDWFQSPTDFILELHFYHKTGYISAFTLWRMEFYDFLPVWMLFFKIDC